MNKYAELLRKTESALLSEDIIGTPYFSEKTRAIAKELRAAAAEMEQAETVYQVRLVSPVSTQYWRDCDHKYEYDRLITEYGDKFEFRTLYPAPVAPAVPTLFINYPEDGIPDDAETAYREGYIAGWSAAPPRVGQGMAAVPESLLDLLHTVGHHGVDFGYGEFQIGPEEVAKAQELYAMLSAPNSPPRKEKLNE